MANKKHLAILKQGVEAWNQWRKENPDIEPDLTEADLTDQDLKGINLSKASLFGAVLLWTDLRCANLNEAEIIKADLTEANLRRTNLHEALLCDANLTHADLRCSDLREADLSRAILVGTDLSNANMEGCEVYGISVWDIRTVGTLQSNLVITEGKPTVTVDNLEVAQFVYLLLHNEKLREVIDTIGKKAVLILGRFALPERKEILEAMREKLRENGYLPIVFDFEKSEERDFTETIKVLAGMSYFVIADITNPKSSPLELQATVPDYMIPFAPIIQKGKTRSPCLLIYNVVTSGFWIYAATTTRNICSTTSRRELFSPHVRSTRS